MPLADLHDTIVAQATPVGEGAVGILRLSGAQSLSLLEKIFRGAKAPAQFQSHHLYFGHLLDPQTEEPLDQVLVAWMKGPHSFTGEDVVEIQAHGGPVLLCRILNVLTGLGARLAEPGEFSKRAYLNGKMDLSQAEAVADLIAAKNDHAVKNALRQLDGVLSKTIHRIRDQILSFLAEIEAGFDFTEEDIQFFDRSSALSKFQQIQKEIGLLLDSFQTGQLYKDGLKIALVGKPNVGKSSLLNALLNEDRAIIHSEPGTTRDVVQGERKIEGIIATFFDTAGIRDSDHVIEQEGIRRSQQTLEKADLLCLLLDSTRPLDRDDEKLLEQTRNQPRILIYNKVDCPAVWKLEGKAFEKEVIVRLSAAQRINLEELLQKIAETCLHGKLSGDHNFVLNNVRHRQALEKANQNLNRLLQLIAEETINEECLVEELRFLVRQLEEITGEMNPEMVLDEIFSRFCIGK